MLACPASVSLVLWFKNLNINFRGGCNYPEDGVCDLSGIPDSLNPDQNKAESDNIDPGHFSTNPNLCLRGYQLFFSFLLNL